MLRASVVTRVLVFSAAIALIAGSVAEAQQPGGRRGGGRGGLGGVVTKAALLQSQAVRTELNVGEDQWTQIQEALRAARPERGQGGRQNLRDLSDEERQARLAELREAAQKAAEETDKKLSEILSEAQTKRLDEILVQQLGVAGLTREPLMSKFGITEDQQTSINSLLQAQRDEIRELGRDIPREERQTKTAEIRAATEKSVLAALTAAQQQQYAAAKGAAFTLDLGAELRGRFGGRQGGARRGQRRGGAGNDNNNI